MAADAAGQGGRPAPVSAIKIPEGYRDWRLIAVAHEEGMLNDLRAILGNDVAIKAAREGAPAYPDGAVIARLAWSYEPLAESEKAFGHLQSFVAGPPKNGVQFMIKDASKYAATGGWGFYQFDGGRTRQRGGARRLLCLPRGGEGAGLRVQSVRALRRWPLSDCMNAIVRREPFEFKDDRCAIAASGGRLTAILEFECLPRAAPPCKQ